MRNAGHRSFGEFHLRLPAVRKRGGDERLLRVEHHLPSDLFAGVGGGAAHDAHQRALGHAVAVVERFAVADRLEELVVLSLVHVVAGAFVLPFGLAVDNRAAGAELAVALRTKDVQVVLVVAAGGLTLSQESASVKLMNPGAAMSIFSKKFFGSSF